MTYTKRGNHCRSKRSTVATQERAIKLSSMHFYAFTMHGSADKEGDELALLHMTRVKTGLPGRECCNLWTHKKVLPPC